MEASLDLRLRISLLLNVKLCTTLRRLALVMLLLEPLLCVAVPYHAGRGAAQGARNTVRHAAGPVLCLARGLLLLALEILLAALLLKGLGADETADSLLNRTLSLVPRAGRTVRVVLCHARGGCREARELRGCVGRIILGLGLLLLGITGSLESSRLVSGQAGNW